ncbi:hypothetical protein HLY00_4447 [Mycolicibacterium hippocampi]|uniref:Uncharacterized protein n=1 Tax=Mycolicibacterium hippocampi TaxID=659824 RepID=A0A850PQ25_9MYCO|nr:hypothetical protein [Mycolicibacterium hippocampi]
MPLSSSPELHSSSRSSSEDLLECNSGGGGFGGGGSGAQRPRSRAANRSTRARSPLPPGWNRGHSHAPQSVPAR